MGKYDVAVIGAGIVGLTTAYELVRRGRRVVIVDSNEPMQGCSYGNAGYLAEANIFPPASRDTLKRLPYMLLDRNGPLVISPGYLPALVPWSIELARSLRPSAEAAIRRHLAALTTRAVDSYAPMLRDIGIENIIRRDGGLLVCMREDTFRARAQSIPVLLDHGVASRLLGRDEVRDLEPALASSIAGAIFYPNSARCLDPARLGLAIASHTLSHGATYLKERVNAINSRPLTAGYVSQEWTLSTSGGPINCTHVVVCAGRGSDSLLIPRGFRIPLASERGYHLMLNQPGVALNRPIVFAESHFAATPMNHGIRLAGTAEFASADKPPAYRRADMLYHLAKRYLPDLIYTRATRWMGIRPTSPDGLPFVGEVATQPGLYYSFGHGHIGLTTAAICAQALVSAMCRENSIVDLTPYSLNRFN
ncbi:NAD(P)/FAD-dependent oxidoreductase [Burkholderia stagnalis]|uniref:NAD(P)/FAD-dependent oxidoreductase n=1 Tax=Burkholderia stagnalis TaxID=1503054 RepID=UPI0009BFD0CA|nr:FAD-dependent oxidoreductase [Burkholderia stagnalis]